MPGCSSPLAAGEAAIGADWAELFFVAPLWRFILPAGACGRFTLIGVLMPSVDAVGRCFPLMLGQEIERPVDPIGLMAGSGPWFAAAEALALDALGEGFDLAELGRDLPSWSVVRGAAVPQSPIRQNGVGTWVELPIASAAPAAVAALAGRRGPVVDHRRPACAAGRGGQRRTGRAGRLRGPDRRPLGAARLVGPAGGPRRGRKRRMGPGGVTGELAHPSCAVPRTSTIKHPNGDRPWPGDTAPTQRSDT